MRGDQHDCQIKGHMWGDWSLWQVELPPVHIKFTLPKEPPRELDDGRFKERQCMACRLMQREDFKGHRSLLAPEQR